MLTENFPDRQPFFMSQAIRPTSRPAPPGRPLSTPASAPSVPASSVPAPQAAVAARPTAPHAHETNEQFEQLLAEHQELSLGRARLQVLHQQAEERIQQCQARAAELGITSLQELQARIVAAEKEDQQVLEDFQAKLQRERDLQETVSRRLADINSPV